MEYCAKCGADGNEIRLFDGIDMTSQIRICERCALLENIPLLKNPSTVQLRESERSGKVYNRLKKISGIVEDKQTRSVFEELRDIEHNSKVVEFSKEKPLRLVDNFHWVLQHQRRHRGLTHKQLAQAIGESEMALKLIERNNLPEDALRVLRKMEQYFRIKLIKPSLEQERQQKQFELEKKEKGYAEKQIQEAYEDIIFPKDDILFNGDSELDLNLDVDSKARSKEGEDMVREAIETEPMGIRKYETADEKHKQPMRVLDFKKEKLDQVTIADLQEIQRVIEHDFPTKSSEEIGREQLESFGKESVVPGIAKKKWFNRYVEKKEGVSEKINSGQGLGNGIPSLQDLAERKKEREREQEKQEVIGSDIEILDEEGL